VHVKEKKNEADLLYSHVYTKMIRIVISIVANYKISTILCPFIDK